MTTWTAASRARIVYELAERDGGLACIYCGHELLEPRPAFERGQWFPTIDHVHPKSAGGSKGDRDNLVLACRSCNKEKGDKLSMVVHILRRHRGRIAELERRLVNASEQVVRLKQERDEAQYVVANPTDAAYEAAHRAVAEVAEGVPAWLVTVAVNAAATAASEGFRRTFDSQAAS